MSVASYVITGESNGRRSSSTPAGQPIRGCGSGAAYPTSSAVSDVMQPAANVRGRGSGGYQRDALPRSASAVADCRLGDWANSSGRGSGWANSSGGGSGGGSGWGWG